jgi:hypothetical protein
VLPPASSTVTTGCCAQAVPLVPVPEGAVVNTNRLAVPTEMLIEGLVVEFEMPVAVAFKV